MKQVVNQVVCVRTSFLDHGYTIYSKAATSIYTALRPAAFDLYSTLSGLHLEHFHVLLVGPPRTLDEPAHE